MNTGHVYPDTWSGTLCTELCGYSWWARPLTKFMGTDVLHTSRISNVKSIMSVTNNQRGGQFWDTQRVEFFRVSEVSRHPHKNWFSYCSWNKRSLLAEANYSVSILNYSSNAVHILKQSSMNHWLLIYCTITLCADLMPLIRKLAY